MVASMSSVTSSRQLISILAEKLEFQIELGKQSFCDLKLANNTEQYVAFKVKTTSPYSYYVRPNLGVLRPWNSCVIRVIRNAQKEYPPDMQCKDRFLFQSTIVPCIFYSENIPKDTFTKESGRVIEEHKLRVVYKYISLNSAQGNYDDSVKNSTSLKALQRKVEKTDASLARAEQHIQRLEEMSKKCICEQQKSKRGWSCVFKFSINF